MEPSFGYQISSSELARLAEFLKHKMLLLIAGPNGAGKGTLTNLLLQDTSLGVEKVRLCTTRPAGLNETDDEDYFYISERKYEEMRENREFLQWQKFPFGCYGISTQALFVSLQRGSCIVIDTGVGAILDLKKFFQEHAIPCLGFFISPVAVETLGSPQGMSVAIAMLHERMTRRQRGESEGDIQDRLDTAKIWFNQVATLPLHVVVNADGKHDEAYRHMVAIIEDHLNNP